MQTKCKKYLFFNQKNCSNLNSGRLYFFYATNIYVFFFATKYSLKRGFCFMQQFSEAEAPRLCCDSYQVALWQPTLGGAPEANCPARLVCIVFVFCVYFVLSCVELRHLPGTQQLTFLLASFLCFVLLLLRVSRFWFSCVYSSKIVMKQHCIQECLAVVLNTQIHIIIQGTWPLA